MQIGGPKTKSSLQPLDLLHAKDNVGAGPNIGVIDDQDQCMEVKQDVRI